MCVHVYMYMHYIGCSCVILSVCACIDVHALQWPYAQVGHAKKLCMFRLTRMHSYAHTLDTHVFVCTFCLCVCVCVCVWICLTVQIKDAGEWGCMCLDVCVN